MFQAPVGVSDFKEIRSCNFAYVDKSLWIVDVLKHSAKVLLFPRPRRFGKTLNLSMLHCFLDRDQDNRELFKGLAVESYPEIMARLGGSPTVFLSFKDVKASTWKECQDYLKQIVTECFIKHKKTLLRAFPEDAQQTNLQYLLNGTAELSLYAMSLSLLCDLLHRATGQKVMLLIDEYDTPIHAGYANGYSDEAMYFMCNFLSAGLKDNRSLDKGVMTGILWVALGSIFSGLNNILARTILDEPFSSHFGFTEAEVEELLAPCHLDLQSVRDWYNGYRFGSHVIYNPWSIIQVADNPSTPLQAHWVNTSDNELIRRLILEDQTVSADDVEQLLFGKGLVCQIDKNIVFGQNSPEMVWSLLLFSGYLTSVKTEVILGRTNCELRIPNLEVRIFFEDTIRNWIRQQAGAGGLSPFFVALAGDKFEVLENFLSKLMRQVLSYHDVGGEESERVYHAFLLGLLMDWRDRYEIQSNRESGWGRYDVALFPRQAGQKGYLFEFKRGDDLEKAARAALAQIEDKAYQAAFQERGIGEVTKIGIGLNGKGCKVIAQTN